MWIGVFDIKRDVENLKENFGNSSISKVLKNFGKWQINIDYGSRSDFTFTQGKREIKISFLYRFDIRRMEWVITDTEYEEIGHPKRGIVVNDFGDLEYKETDKGYLDIHKELFVAFREWINEINLDCMLYITQNPGVVEESESFGDRQKYTFTGKESKKIVELMKSFPLHYTVDKNNQMYLLKMDRVFSRANFIVTFYFYPKPCVHIIYGNQEYHYQEDLLDLFTMRKCETFEEVSDFFKWTEEIQNETKKIRDELFERLKKVKENQKIEFDGDFVDLVDEDEKTAEQTYGVHPIIKGFEQRYLVISPGRVGEWNSKETTVKTIEEGIHLCALDRKKHLEMYEAIDEIKEYISKFEPKELTTKAKANEYVEEILLYGQRLRWKITYQFDKEITVPYYTATLDSDVLFESSFDIIEVKEEIKNKIDKLAQSLRIRYLMKDKQSI